MASERLNESAIQRAASLPEDAPHILGIDETDETESTGESPFVMDIDDLEADLRDRQRGAFMRGAINHRKKLAEEGRILPSRPHH
jgi:hypothetical protein